MARRLPGRSAVTIMLVALAVALMPFGPMTAAGASTSPTQPQLSVTMHNELLGTDPSDGAHLDTGPARVALTFNAPAQRGFSTVVVTGPDGQQWQAGPATEEGAMVLAPVRPLGPAGDYTVAWRIISADGHPARGTFRFSLTTPGPHSSTVAAPRDPEPVSVAAETGSGGMALWPWLAGVGALVAVGLVLTLRASRARR